MLRMRCANSLNWSLPEDEELLDELVELVGEGEEEEGR
jgi:hypothetical protein